MSLWTPIVRPTRNFLARRENRKMQALAQALAPLLKPAEPTQTSQPSPLYDITPSRAFRQIAKEFDLVEVYRDVWEIYTNDGDIAAAVDGIGIDAAQKDNEGYPFRFTNTLQADPAVQVDPETGKREPSPAQARINEVYDRLEGTFRDAGIYRELAHAISMAALFGRYGLERVWDFSGNQPVLCGVKPIPGIDDGLMLRKLYDEQDVHVGWGLFDVTTQERVQEFDLFRVMVFDWNNVHSILTSIRLQWKEVRESETDLYVARKNRASIRYGFINPKWTEDQVIDFMKRMDALKRSGELGPDADLAGSTDIKLFDPQNTMLDPKDLAFRRSGITSAARKPLALLPGHGSEGINRDTLREQVKGYIRFLGELDMMVAGPLIQTAKIQLLAWGFSPSEYTLDLKWTQKDERDFLPTVQALAILRGQADLSKTTMLTETGFSPAEEAENNRLDEEGSGPSPEQRVAQEMLALMTKRNQPGPNGDAPGQNGTAKPQNGNRIAALTGAGNA